MAKSSSAELQSMTGKLFITRGIVSVLFGIIALVWPGLTLVSLGLLLSIWLLVVGATGLVSSVLNRHETQNWVFTMLLSLLQLGVGAYLVQRPGISVATVVALVAITLIAEGVIELVVAFIDSESDNRVMAVIGGLLGILAGVVIWRYPVSGGLAFVWVLGLYSLVIGSFTIAAGAELNKK